MPDHDRGRPHGTSRRWTLRLMLAMAGIALLVVAGVDFPFFLKIVTIGGTALFIFSIVVMLVTFRKAKRIAPRSLFISVVMSLASLGIYSLMLGLRLPLWFNVASFTSGLFIGTGWAMTTPIRVRKGVVEREGTLWYLVVWALILAFNQIATSATGRPPRVATVLLWLGTGVAVGNGTSLIAMAYRAMARNRVAS